MCFHNVSINRQKLHMNINTYEIYCIRQGFFFQKSIYWSIAYIHKCAQPLSLSTFYRIHTAAEIDKAVYMWTVLFLPIMSFLLADFAALVMEEVKKTRGTLLQKCATERPFQEDWTQGWNVTASPFPSPACSWGPLPPSSRATPSHFFL